MRLSCQAYGEEVLFLLLFHGESQTKELYLGGVVKCLLSLLTSFLKIGRDGAWKDEGECGKEKGERTHTRER